MTLAAVATWAGPASALARGVGQVCGELRSCDSNLSCTPTPIRNRCVPNPTSYGPGSRTKGQACYDTSDCGEGLACSGGTSRRMHKRKCEAEIRIDVTDLSHGDVVPCACGVSAATGGRVVRPGDMFDALNNDQKLVAPFDVGDAGMNQLLALLSSFSLGLLNPFAELGARHQKLCACAVVEDLRGPWTPSNGGVDGAGHASWCVGMCGEQCGERKLGLTHSHVRYGGLIIHDVCQAYIGSTDAMFPFGQFNACADEGHLGFADYNHSERNQAHSCSRSGPTPALSDLLMTPAPGTAEATARLIRQPLDQQVLVGDFDGDGRDDRFEYRPGPPLERLVLSGDGSAHNHDVGGTYTPLVADFDGDGDDDIFWYRPGRGDDYLWKSRGDGTFASMGRTVNGVYEPVLGDFDGDGITDIFWYRPGTGADYLWLFQSNGGRVSLPRRVDEVFVPLAGDFDGDGRTDIFWHDPDAGVAHVWMSTGAGGFAAQLAGASPGGSAPFVSDWDDDGWDDIVFDASSPLVWLSRGDGTFVPSTEARYDDLMTTPE